MTEGEMMRHYALALFLFSLIHVGCTHNIWSFQPAPFKPTGIEYYERIKREFLHLEDIKVGDGPIAAAGRRVTADLTIHYADGTLVYEGPIVTYWGVSGRTWIANMWHDHGWLSLDQTGIVLGLNGMAVGGRRRFTVAPKLVCGWDGSDEAAPHKTCLLTIRSNANTRVRKEALTVEATLTSACAPLYRDFAVGYEDLCQDSDRPKREPGDPIWRFYHAEPFRP